MMISFESFNKTEGINSEEFSFLQSGQISILPSKSYVRSSYKIPKQDDLKTMTFSLEEFPMNSLVKRKTVRKLSRFSSKPSKLKKKLSTVSHTQEDLKPVKEEEEHPSLIKDLEGLRKGPSKYHENMMRNFVRISKVPYEKEELKEEFITLRSQTDELLKQNSQLRIAYSHIKKATKNDEDLVQETSKYLNENKKMKTSQKQTIYMSCLKNELDNLKNEVKAHEELLKTLRKHPKILKIQELDLEIKANIEETKRLQNLFLNSSKILTDDLMEENDQTMIIKDTEILHKYELQSEIIKNLKSELKQLEEKREVLIEKRNELQIYNDEINEKHNVRTYKLYLEKKRDLHKKQLEIKENKDLIEKYHQDINNLIIKSQIPSREQMKTEALLNAEQQLKHLIYEKDQIINYQTKLISEWNSKLEYKSAFELKEKKLLQDNLDKQKAIFKDCDEKYKLLCKTHGIEERKIEDKAHGLKLKRANDIEDIEAAEEASIIILEKEKANKKKEIVKQVLYDDVMNYGYELNLALKIKKLDYSTAEKKLFPEKSKRRIITLKDLIEILKKEPFSMADEKKALLIARFLIENPNNKDKFLELDYDRTLDLAEVKKNLKLLVGEGNHISDYEEKDLKIQLSSIIQQNYESLSECFEIMEETKDKEFVSFKVILDAFRFLEIQLTDKQLEYLLMNLFAYTYDLETLPYQKIYAFAEKLPCSPLLKSPTSKRLNSMQLHQKGSDLTMKKFPRSSMAVGGKRTSKLTSMTEQIEELSRTQEFTLQTTKEVHTSTSSSQEESNSMSEAEDEDDDSDAESKS